MRIVYVIPGPMSKTQLGAAEVRRRGEVLRGFAFPGTEVSIVDVETGPASIESAYEEYLSVPAAVEKMVEVEEAGFDAAILGCFGDPGLDAIREMVEMPVVGPGEAACLLAASLGYRFSILTIAESVVGPTRHQVHRIGVHDKFASVRVVDTPVLELMANREAVFQRLIEQGNRCIRDDGADTLVLGCMTMGFLGVAEELSARLGVPVVNPGRAALKFAEALVGAGLRHSKRGYMTPPKLAAGKVRSKRELVVR